MSATKRPSAVSGLRRGVGTAETAQEPGQLAPENRQRVADLPPAEESKARVTLNLPAPLYRDIERWAMEAADQLGVRRVGIQEAMRAMIKVAVVDKSIGVVVVDQLHRDRGA